MILAMGQDMIVVDPHAYGGESECTQDSLL